MAKGPDQGASAPRICAVCNKQLANGPHGHGVGIPNYGPEKDSAAARRAENRQIKRAGK